jgi:O-antigen/teichoic acid export membrane protein
MYVASIFGISKKPASYRFIKGVATYQVGNVVSILTGMASSIVYARLLGVREFGLYAGISAVAALLGLVATYGQETAATTFFAEAIGKKDHAAMERTIRYYVQASLVATGVTFVLVALAPVLSAWLQHGAEIGQYVRVVLLNSAMEPPNFLFFLVLQINHRITELTLWENSLNILQLLLATILLLLGWGIWGILVGTIAVTAVTVPLFLYFYERNAQRSGFPRLEILVPRLLKWDTGQYMEQGFWMALDQGIGKTLYPNLFFVILAATAPLEAVGIFRLAFRLATLPLSFIMPPITRMTAIVMPRIAGEGYRQTISASQKVLLGSVSLAILAVVGMAILAPPLIPILYGTAYLKAIPFLLILLPVNVIAAAQVLTIPVLRVYRRVWAIILLNLLGLAAAITSYETLYAHLTPLFAISIAIVVFHLVSLLLFPYLGYLFRHQSSLVSSQSA